MSIVSNRVCYNITFAVSCPSGSYFNKSQELCTDCVRGTYQPNVAQLICKQCPTGMTSGVATIYQEQC